jgi:hypothetical protein
MKTNKFDYESWDWGDPSTWKDVGKRPPPPRPKPSKLVYFVACVGKILERLGIFIGLILVVLFVIVATSLFVENSGNILTYIAPSATRGYALKYKVADSNVAIDKQPHDCEYDTAPLGNKHCHYEAQVQWTQTATSADGFTPLISYDGGKTWIENTAHLPPSVFVSWMKVLD